MENLLKYNYNGPGGPAGGGGGGGIESSTQVAYLSLTDQSFVSNVSFPTHFTVPFASGVVTTGNFYLQQIPSGSAVKTVIPAQCEVVGRWPDNSVKWMHVYANGKWINGNKCSYQLRWDNAHSPVAGSLSASEDAQKYTINTGATTFTVPKAHPAIICPGVVSSGNQLEVQLSGNNSFYAASGVPTWSVELSGTNILTLKATGNYIGSGTSFAKYTVRIIARSNSPIVELKLANTFTQDMRTRFVSYMGWYFPDFTGEVLTRYIANKEPASVIQSLGNTTFAQWTPNLPDTNAPEDYTDINELWKLKWLKKGPYLNASMPTGYRAGFTGQLVTADTTELTMQTVLNADLIGVTFQTEFAINLGATSGSQYQDLWEAKPIGHRSPAIACATKVMGPIGAYGSTYTESDDLAKQTLIGSFNNEHRYNLKGWHVFGNAHHDEYPFRGRPSYHRLWSNNHYGITRALWTNWFASADKELLEHARKSTDNTSNITQIRHTPAVDSGRCRYEGAIYHCKSWIPWGFRASGQLSYGDELDTSFCSHFAYADSLLLAFYMDADYWAKDGYDLWLNGIGRYTGPAGSVGFRWPITSYGREVNTSLYQALIAYEYNPTQSGVLAGISGMKTSLMDYYPSGVPFTLGTQPGPIWESAFLSKYYELFPNDLVFKEWLLDSANNVGVNTETEGEWGMALAATAYDITGDENYIRQFSGVLDRMPRRPYNGPSGAWLYFGNQFVTDDDGMYSYQWPRFKYALNRITEVTKAYEIGTYFAGRNTWSSGDASSASDAVNRGTKVYILGDNPVITNHITSIAGGDATKNALWYTQQSGYLNAVLVTGCLASTNSNIDQDVPRVTRSSSWYVLQEQYTLPTTGLVQVMYNGDAIGLFRNLSTYPEAQILDSTTPGYATKLGSGCMYVFSTNAMSGTIKCGLSPFTSVRSPAYVKVGNNPGVWLLPGEVYNYTVPGRTYTTFECFTDGAGGSMTATFSGTRVLGRLGLYGSSGNIATLLPLVSGLNW